MHLKFEHALMVRTCDVFETVYSGSLVSQVFQADSARLFFSILLSSSLDESDALKRLLF